jgi:endonuclease/exonuclease/phosphatase family metal-dependent hydrolase
MTVNMLKGSADAAAIVTLVRDHHVDLLALQEVTPDAVSRLDAAGLADLLPNRSVHPMRTVGGSALLSRFPLHDDGLRVMPWQFGQARATVTPENAAPFAVESAHPCAPSGPERDSCWVTGLAQEPPATVDGQVRLLIGDFNATLDHWALRHLLATGYRDAADTVGAGFATTWPYNKPIPKIAIDHVLVDRRVGVRRVEVYPVPHSDHRALFAELVLPPV